MPGDLVGGSNLGPTFWTMGSDPQYQNTANIRPAPTPTPTLSSSAASTITGTQTDTQFALQIVGKDIPVFVGGELLMGCRIIEGPFVYTSGGVSYVDMIVTPALAATPTAARTITKLHLNGTLSATSADGGTTWTVIGPALAGMQMSIRPGSETQTPFASSITRFGDKAVPYLSHILMEIKRIPLAVFNNQIPFASILVHETSTLVRNNALSALARYARYADTEFEFDVSGSDVSWVVPQQTTLIAFLQDFRKIFRNWNITLSDKLRVFENFSSSGIDAVLTRGNTVADSIKFSRLDPLSLPRQRDFTFVSTLKDNDFDTVTARRERFPVPLTASQDTDTIELPIVMGSQAISLVNQSMLIDDVARTRMACTVGPSLYGIEPGDIVSFDDDPSVSFIGRVVSAARKTADFTVDIECEMVDSFTLNIRPVITSDGGLSTASVSVLEHQTAVTTVTATDANDDVLTYSISGGADAAFFTIDSSTGVLTFLSAPVFATPADADANNDYIVTVQVSDGSLVDTQTITVTVLESVSDDTLLLLLL